MISVSKVIDYFQGNITITMNIYEKSNTYYSFTIICGPSLEPKYWYSNPGFQKLEMATLVNMQVALKTARTWMVFCNKFTRVGNSFFDIPIN